MDYARRYSDEQMEELRRQLEEIYGQAATEVEQKLEGFNHAFARKSQQHLADVKAGKWTQAQYQRWLLGQVFQGKQWKQKLSDITGVYTKADKIARQIIGTGNLSIFAEAANYTAFNIEQNAGLGIAFNLYDRSTVKRLLLDRPQMLPEWKIDEPKDYAWNEKRVRNAVMQGIIQGESVPDIGKRLCGELATSNGRKMGLFARTAITGAENAGRVARMEEAQDMGITVQKQWIATLDSRTRDAHQDLDGQIQDPDKPFKSALGDIMFPGDPSADPANVFNCRCTLGYYYPEYKPQNMRRRAYNDPDSRDSEVIEYQTYKEWKSGKEEKNNQQAKSTKQIFTQKDAYTEFEKEAIHEYTTVSYSGVNSALREGTVEKYESIKRIVDGVDSAMKKTVVGEGTVASRGASMADLRGMFEDKRRSWFEDPDNLKSLEGKTAPFKSYISATKGESVAEPYKRELQWHFITEGEVHGVDAEQFASSSVKVEREILFDRDALIEIEKVKFNVDSDGDIDGVVEIWAKIKQSKSLN